VSITPHDGVSAKSIDYATWTAVLLKGITQNAAVGFFQTSSKRKIPIGALGGISKTVPFHTKRMRHLVQIDIYRTEGVYGLERGDRLF
jgi:hypothetical protein